ncbi:MAG: flavin reductase family protein [Candidatus Omnitrophica bacterium]|jgi:flavin reductase (DIM6/NTAB) family NADH-FMN oxidoreductase RutF|nr:flavin reductase family protein [Candidatus Omnitrophota bacterium]
MKKSIGAKTIIFPTPVLVVGTYDQLGKPNAATCAWGGICCSSPAAVAVSFRENRHTYAAISQRKAFTVSIPSEKYLKEADYFGVFSGKTEDKFASVGLTAARSEIVDAPYVSEFPLVLECSLLQCVRIGIHTQFIGEIKNVLVEESVLNKEGLPDIKKINPLVFDPAMRVYFGIGQYLDDAFKVEKKKPA